MGNEMGNTINSSGNQEDENAATNTQQKQEVVVNTESVQGKRNIIHEDETKGYHEKPAESPSTNDDPTVYYEGDKQENAGKKRDNKRTEPSDQAFHELHFDDAAPSTIMKEDYAMKVANVAKAIDSASIQTNVSPAKHQHPVEQPIYAEEVFEMVAEKGTCPTKFTEAANNHEQMKIGIVAREGGRVEKSCIPELTDKCILQLGTFKSGDDAYVESSSFSLNSRYPDGMVQGSDAAEEWNVGITHLKEQIGSELLVIEDSDVQILKENKSLENPKLEAEDEDEQKVQKNIEVLAFINGKCVNGEMLPLFQYTAPSKTPEISIQRFSVESNSEKSGDETELRKSPSFDFGVSYDAKSEESDQTPLVYPEKTLTRSLSLGSPATFSKLTTKAEYDGNLLEYEKTNRMERSDYQGLLKTGENSESELETDPKTLPPKELLLTSPKGSGKRQPRPSFFSSCICCTTAIR